MPTTTFRHRRSQLEEYFDRTAADTWATLTSDAPVSRVRATVRAGRDQMRDTLLQWLPQDLTGKRLLDAGCGTGALAVEAARRGAEVVAVDVAPNLLDTARERLPDDLPGSVEFIAGDMLDPSLGRFDHAVAMDSLIHYRLSDVVASVSALAGRIDQSLLFTFVPRTPLLSLMHLAGKLFPRGDRSPAIQPVAEKKLAAALDDAVGWNNQRRHPVASGFYISHAMELCRE
ncbi:MAG: magnesium protoporphyrin IX methyltransferase [Xanthomonadales bacterium]|nr:magnesium protoporphyrin IX methyltransferase [Xanthomonadales bacterium]